MKIYDNVSPLDYRYYAGDKKCFERLKPYVSEEAFIKYQLKVERTLIYALFDLGLCSSQVADEVRKACEETTAEEVYKEEKKIQHIVRALANCIRRKVSPDAQKFVHLFATSADITDTANALRLQELTRNIILPDLIQLQGTLIKIARDYAHVVQIGRTHGKHAEPITFGFAMASYVSRIGSRIKFIENARQNLRGKFSGAVGAYNALSLPFPKAPHLFEKLFLAYLGLQPTDTSISTQIVEPEYQTDLVYAITSCFSVLANLADDIRHLHRTEIAEVQEKYKETVVGSSTMPHKVNPKNFEHVKSMWKEFMPRMITSFMDQISEHQRDLTNSASGRFVTELFTAFDYSIVRLVSALKSIQIDTDKMRVNLEMSKHSIIAEPLYILLALNGYTNAYNYVRTLISNTQGNNRKLTELIWKDKEIKPFLEKLPEKHKTILRDPSKYIGHSYERTILTCDEWEKQATILSEYLKKEAKVLEGIKVERFRTLYRHIREAEEGISKEPWRKVSTEPRREFIKAWIEEQKLKRKIGE